MNSEANEFKIQLRAQQVSCRLKKTKKLKEGRLLLDAVDFVANPGELVAIMGPSGAGKTTLLSALSGRIGRSTELNGNILVNSSPVNIREYRQHIGFVEQDDILFETATVRESIMFSAMLRLPQAMAESEKTARVDEVIRTLGLEKCQDTRIGDPNKRGISGGERKRTSIGIELVTRPSLLFLDEPTSGLDSSSAYQVVHLLKQLAQSGRTIICTIHQPRASIFTSFDKVTLLQNGRLMYYGPPKPIAKFFQRMGYEREQFDNIADYILDVASGKFIGTMASDAKTPDEITEEYCQSKYYKYLSDEATSTVISSSSDAKQSTFVTRRPW
jgi:ATP-binding cassette subfamily G (WHITE) protein 2